MYGSWYWGSQASSWIFWWAFARLCRLTSTPHARGFGRTRSTAARVRAAARSRFLGSRDGRGRRGPQEAARSPARLRAVLLVVRITLARRVAGGLNMRRRSQSASRRLGSLELGRPGAAVTGARRNASPSESREMAVSVSKGATSPPLPAGPAASSALASEIARARTLFLVDEPVIPGLVRDEILASWTRSRLRRGRGRPAGRSRTDQLELPYGRGVDDDTLRPRAAELLLRDIAALFAAEPVSVILSDAD